MYIKQLSVFIENREGRLQEVLQTLALEKVNIVSLSLADTADYGLLRLIVSDPEGGKRILTEHGFSAMLTEVIAVKLKHKVGQLQEILRCLGGTGVNIEYMYALSIEKEEASIVLKASDVAKAGELLHDAGIEFITKEDITRMSE